MTYVDPVPVEVDPIPPDPFGPGELDPGSTFDYPPPWLPAGDQTTIYTGLGAQPAWEDVYKWAEGNFDAVFAQGYYVAQNLKDQGVLTVGQAAIGSVLKAVSGFINQTVDTMEHQFTELYQTLQFVLGGLDDTNRSQDVKILHLQQEVQGLATIVAAEEKQIVGLRETIFNAVEFEGAYIQDWATKTILEPLLSAIVQEQRDRDAAILRSDRNVLDQSHLDVLAELAPVVATATALATKVATLTQESETCTQPMCETMGPNTPLGKFLKGLNLAADLALLAELAKLDRNGVESLLRGLQSLASGVINEFDQLFIGSGGTLGDTITGAGG